MVLLTLTGIAIDITYKIGSFVLGSVGSVIKRSVFGKPPLEQKIDTLLLKVEEQKHDIERLERELSNFANLENLNTSLDVSVHSKYIQ